MPCEEKENELIEVLKIIHRHLDNLDLEFTFELSDFQFEEITFCRDLAYKTLKNLRVY